MKLIALILLVGFMQVSANIYSQTANINLDVEQSSLREVIEEIQKQTVFTFFYSLEDIKGIEVRDLDLKGSSLESTLDRCLAGTNLKYEIKHKAVILRKEVVSPVLETKPEQEAPESKKVTGKVLSNDGEPIPGVAIIVKGTTQGTVTDIDGNYNLEVPSEGSVLVFSFIGFVNQEVAVGNQSVVNVTLSEDVETLDEVVVVGYGVQTKQSVVGSIAVTTNEEIMQTGGVTNLGNALGGLIPGVVAVDVAGRPGQDDPELWIRGRGTWNGGQPLILVDQIERRMSDIDFNEVESISVLKDASATAVFGVKGANGVILITTKRGKEGKPVLKFSANTTLKTIDELPDRVNAYEEWGHYNASIERQLGSSFGESLWADYMPYEVRDMYRNQQTQEDYYRYPDVDWYDKYYKPMATDYRFNASASGGSKLAKYFFSLSYQHVADIFDTTTDDVRSYDTDFNYDRFNYRINLDFDITKTTRLSTNVAGFYAMASEPSYHEKAGQIIRSSITTASGVFYPYFPEEDLFGKSPYGLGGNALPILNHEGARYQQRFEVTSDFVLDQKLDFITEGLSFKGSLSYDNRFIYYRKLSDYSTTHIENRNVVYKSIDPFTGEVTIEAPAFTGNANNFDRVKFPWNISDLISEDGDTRRRIFYQFALNYKRSFNAVHNVSVLALMNREEYAQGSMLPRFREDWVARATYNYDSRYFIDLNGAYNGSEKFGPDYRFELFPSVALGWMLSEESFLNGVEWLDMLKIRGSYGLVGDDSAGARWGYLSQWNSGGTAKLSSSGPNAPTPYNPIYREASIGNPDLRWETAKKTNIGFDFSALGGKFTAAFDAFLDKRYDIIIVASQRKVSSIFGFAPPAGNLGETKVTGYEVTLGGNHTFDSGMKVWLNLAFTKAKDEVIYREDPELALPHMRQAGYPIGHQRLGIEAGMLQSWDDVYMSTPRLVNQTFMRPGMYDLVDFIGNGIYDATYDEAPYGYTTRPQNTATWTLGFDYKGFSVMARLYGVWNVTKNKGGLNNFRDDSPKTYAYTTDYWTVDNTDAARQMELIGNSSMRNPTYFWHDASLLRLKTAEVSYNFTKLKLMGISSMRAFVNGNNLASWHHMPDNRMGSDFSYPMLKQVNIGLDIKF